MLKFYNNLGENFRKVYVPQHIILLVGLYYMFMGDISSYWLLMVYPAWFLFGHIGFGIFIHKYYCHQSFKTYDWIAKLGAYFGMLSGTGSPLMLRMLHQGYHHKFSDTDQDPHTPKHGFWWSYYKWLNHKWDFRKVWVVKDMVRDPTLMFFHRQYYKIYWGTWLLLACFSVPLAIFTITVATVIEFHLSGIVNTYGHTKHWGSYQNYTDGDDSQNMPILNWLTLGLGLHNNHHAKPWEYNYAHKKGEFDFAEWFVPLIEKK